MTHRFLFLATAILACSLSACAPDDSDAPAKDSTGATSAPTDDSSATTQINYDPAATAQDSIPVRTPDGKPARFGWKSGHVILRYSGGLTGKREIYFDDWGLRESRLDSTVPAENVPGPKQYTRLIATPDRFVMIDIPQKTGWTQNNESDEKYLASDSSKSFSLGEIIFRSSGGVRKPDEIVDGVKVTVLEMSQGDTKTKIWVRQGLVIKEKFTAKDGGGFSVEPELMLFNVDVPTSLWDVPAGIKLQERPNQGSPQGGPPPTPSAPQIVTPPGGAPRGAMPPGMGPLPMPPPGGR